MNNMYNKNVYLPIYSFGAQSLSWHWVDEFSMPVMLILTRRGGSGGNMQGGAHDV